MPPATTWTACGPSWSRFSSEYHGVAIDAVVPHLYQFVDLEAARHLFRVAAGLDSLVVGEPQILGQVKDAHGAAAASQSAGPVLNRLFHSSFGVGKRVRTETGLGSGAVSVSFAAVSLARKIFGDLKGRTVLVVGAGEMGKLTARHLKSQGVQQVTIVSRSMAHAARTAEAIGGASAAPWEELDTALGAGDIVITATGAAAPILTKAHVEAVMRPRRHRPLFIIDIAMPRDVEAAAGEIEQVFLYNIDDLQATVRENLARRGSEIDARRDDRRRRGREVRRLAPIAWRDSDGGRPEAAVRDHPPRRGRTAAEALGASARCARARRRDHAPHRGETAVDADRAAQVGRRPRDRRRVQRGLDEVVRPRRAHPPADAEPSRPKIVEGPFNRTNQR